MIPKYEKNKWRLKLVNNEDFYKEDLLFSVCIEKMFRLWCSLLENFMCGTFMQNTFHATRDDPTILVLLIL